VQPHRLTLVFHRSDRSKNRELDVTEGVDPLQPEFEEAAAQLDEGLKSCRTVVRNYRAILGSQAESDDSVPPETQTVSGRARPQ
jgi:hypothetical protein